MRKLRTTIVLLAFGLAACSSGDPGSAEKATPSPEPPVTTTVPEVTTTTVPEPVQVEQAPPTTEPEPEHVHPPVTVARSRTTTTVHQPWTIEQPAPQGRSTSTGSGACGGSLPPCSVMGAESGGDPGAVNATGCGGRGCYGKWQFDPRTSQGLGYAGVMTDYPESVQDEAAATLWDGGRGCSAWDAC